MEKRTSDFYQFSEKPFENTPDPKFLYLAPSHLDIFASILTWIKEGHGFAAITGEAGTGKTFFIHALLSHLDEKVTPILVLNPVITFRDLLMQILLVLKQPTREKSESTLFHRFTGFLDQMMAQDKTLLIILDEAQDLNDRTLEDIERFLDLTSKPIRIIFVGQPHFDERLNSMGLRRLGQKIKIKQKIKPFTEEESRRYIDHRLRLVGSSSEILTPKAISMICSYTQGISSLINHVCDNALWVGCTMNREKIDVDIIEKVIQNLEGPRIHPKALPSTQLIKRIWKSPIQFAISFKRVSIAIFLLVWLGGLIFLLYEYIGRGPMKIQVIKSFIGQKLATRPSTHKPSVQGTIEGILKKDRIPTSDEPKLTQPESSSLQRDTVLLKPRKGKQQPKKVTVDEALNMVSSVKKKESLPSSESGLKTDYGEEAPKLLHDISKTLKTQALTITHFFAADKGPYGCIWQIYIEAEDPDGDMDRISVEVDQVNYGHYPTEWIMIKPPHRKHFTGFLQWNTFSSKASYLPEGTQISVKISIFDQAGNKSNKVIIPFTFGSGVIKRYQLPAPFDKGNIPRIGYVMVDLCSASI
jgi:general secretion pathway protein A